jgi:hypothetical protein
MDASGWHCVRTCKEAAITASEDVVRILQSRRRREGGTEDAGADINNLLAAVRELQDAVVKLAEEIDRATASSPARLRTRARPAAPVRTVEP